MNRERAPVRSIDGRKRRTLYSTPPLVPFVRYRGMVYNRVNVNGGNL